MKRPFEALLEGALDAAIATGALSAPVRPACVLEAPEHPDFGDATCRVAMVLARRLGRPAADVAAVIVRHVADPHGWLEGVEAAGPGFVNLRVSLGFWRSTLAGTVPPFGAEEATSALVVAAADGDDPDARRVAVVADLVAAVLAAVGRPVARAARPLAAIAGVPGLDAHGRVVVVHGHGETKAAARVKAAVGGRPGRVTAVATGPLAVVRRSRRVDAREVADALALPAARFALAAAPADVPVTLDVARLRDERVDQAYHSVRYALARIARVEARETATGADLDALGEAERECLRGVGTHADALDLAARRLAPDEAIAHGVALAAAFHRYYNRGRFVTGDSRALAARRTLARGVARVLERTLALAEPPAGTS
jgi:arginyl-tRNA synthetase